MKAKIAEVHQIPPSDEGVSCYSDPNELARSVQMKAKFMKPMYNNLIDPMSTKRSTTNESKVSVYYTPNDSVDQPQLQLSPMHINFIQENLNTFSDCLKPSESVCKLDFGMHRFGANLEQEINRRRRQIGTGTQSDDDDDDDEIIEINSEQTRMLNRDDANVVDNMAINSTQGYIRLNTLPKRNKYKRAASGKDLYYSLENIFDAKMVDSHLYQLHASNKTIDEASETQMTTSVSDNCSSNDMSRSNATNAEDSSDEQQRNPSQSVSVLNEVASSGVGVDGDGHSDIQTSNSMPNISKSEQLTKEHIADDTDQAIVNNNSQLDQKLPN